MNNQSSQRGKTQYCVHCSKLTCPFSNLSTSMQLKFCPYIEAAKNLSDTPHDEMQGRLTQWLKRHVN